MNKLHKEVVQVNQSGSETFFIAGRTLKK